MENKKVRLAVYRFVKGAVFSVIISIPVLFLWNWVVPDVIGWGRVSILQAWGLVELCSLLFHKQMED